MTILSYLWSWCTPLYISVYLVLSALPYLAMFKASRKFKGTPDLNAKYWAFERLDLKEWSLIRFILIMVLTGGIFRFIIGWLMVLSLSI